jgi:hypothetical protein
MDPNVTALIEIAKTHREVQRARDEYIFKVVIATLTLEAVFIASLLSGTYSQLAASATGDTAKKAVSIALTLLAILTSVHVFLLHRANHSNKFFAERNEQIAVNLMKLPGAHASTAVTSTKYCGCHMWAWQSAFLILGTIAAAFLVSIQ